MSEVLALRIPSPAVTDAPSDRVGFVAIGDAARILRVSDRHLRRLCSDHYEASGLARKVDGEWQISRRIHPTLSGIETDELRYHRQLGEIREKGASEKAIRRAEALRKIILDFPTRPLKAHDEAGRQREYVNHLAGSGKLREAGIKKYSPRSLRRHVAAYWQRGDSGGLKALIRRTGAERGQISIGAEAWDFFIGVKHVTRDVTVSSAYDQVAGYVIERKLKDDPAWQWPALRTVQNHYAASVPDYQRVYATEGPQAFRAKCLPKVARDYSNIEAGEILCGDERTLDFMGRAIGDRGWRRGRFKVTAWLEVRSRSFKGWHIGEAANSDTILAAFKHATLAMETLPRRVIIDNGRDYQSVGGGRHKSGKWDGRDERRENSAFERLEVEVTYATPRTPWAKIIESHFNAVKAEFDRYFSSYWGGSPAERPHDADRWTKANLMSLPTVEEVRDGFKAFLEAHHEVPQRGDGMDGMTPNQAFRTFYTATPRRVTSATLDVVCTKRVGPVKVTRDGVRYQGIQYGKWQEQVWRMQGQQVWLAVDPIEGDRVTICEEDGRPIIVAMVDNNRGETREEIREAIAFQRRCQKSMKGYAQAREYTLLNRPQQIAARRALAAKARQMPDSDLPDPMPTQSVGIVRPDIAAAAEQVKRASGAEALRRLTSLDAKAEAVNQGRRVDICSMGAGEIPSEEPTRRRVAVWDIPVNAEDDSNAS
ncbi:MAG TPA: Mu transposase C-terminal domain-containing protein [Phycisphaerae bacterium]|nr:Mu transposase C-terminal domain-containing protein [Phycisphaerae bacterium]